MSREFRPIVERQLLELGGAEPIVAGVSGGADSVSLLRAIAESSLAARLRVAHLDHQLRGKESTADAAWVAQLCQSLNVPCVVGMRDVAELARTWGLGIEEAARRARYEFFEEVATQCGAKIVALAHTADDQAETILHHILRGTGLAGLRGMPAVRPLNDDVRLVRPLLCFRKTEILEYLAERGQTYREDRTNTEADYTRNRIRGQLIPLLEQEYNPQVVEGLLRLSEQAEDMHSLIVDLADQLLGRVLLDESPQAIRLNATALRCEPSHVVREMFVLVWKQHNWPRQKMGFEDWNRLVHVAIHGTAVTLPGSIEARKVKETLVIRELGPLRGR